MALLDQWRDGDYDESANKGDLQRFWGDATAGSLNNNMSGIYKY